MDADGSHKSFGDGDILRTLIASGATVEKTIEGCVSVTSHPADGYPPNFFEVEVAGISRHAAGRLLNSDAVAAYVSEVCPVPLSNAFPFASAVDEILVDHGQGFSLDVRVNDADASVRRLDHPAIVFSDTLRDDFADLETFTVPDVFRRQRGRHRLACTLWILRRHSEGSRIPRSSCESRKHPDRHMKACLTTCSPKYGSTVGVSGRFISSTRGSRRTAGEIILSLGHIREIWKTT